MEDRKNFLIRKRTEIIVSCVIIFLCQLVPTYDFYKIENDLNKFRAAEIKNIKIDTINYLHYRPGNWNSKYLQIVLNDNKSYPFITENYEDREKISLGDYVQKNKNSSELLINDRDIFILKDLTMEKILERLFMLLVSSVPVLGILFGKKNTK